MDWNASVDRAGTGENAVKYLGQYVRRSVISDGRILGIEGNHVRIRIKNRDTGTYASRLIDGVEFVRRFLQHALPPRFHRIRYRGFLHARGKPTLDWLRLILDARLQPPEEVLPTAPHQPTCPRCGKAMHRVRRMPRAPVSAQRTLFPLSGRMNLTRSIEPTPTPLPSKRCQGRLRSNQENAPNRRKNRSLSESPLSTPRTLERKEKPCRYPRQTAVQVRALRYRRKRIRAILSQPALSGLFNHRSSPSFVPPARLERLLLCLIPFDKFFTRTDIMIIGIHSLSPQCFLISSFVYIFFHFPSATFYDPANELPTLATIQTKASVKTMMFLNN